MPATQIAKVDHALLQRLTSLIYCSRCLRNGRKTPVMQIISPRHRPRSLCTACGNDGVQPGIDYPIRPTDSP